MTRRLIAPLALAFVGTAVACVDLKETPITGITSAYYATPSGFESAVGAMYQPLRSFWGLERGATMTVFGTDEFQKGADGSYKFFNDYTSALTGDVDFIQQTWRDFYQGINTANTVIDVAKTANLPAATLSLRVAEAKFLRAMYYFTLVRTYGDVPLTLTPTAGVQTNTTRETTASRDARVRRHNASPRRRGVRGAEADDDFRKHRARVVHGELDLRDNHLQAARDGPGDR